MKNKFYFLLLAALMTAQFSNAQKCSFEPTAADWEQYRQAVQAIRGQTAQERDDTTTTYYVGVQFHILWHEFQQQYGGGLTEAAVAKELDYANAKFAPAHIQFFQCGAPHIIVNNDWFNHTFIHDSHKECGETTPEYQFNDLYKIPGMINIYWVNTDGYSWSSFPSWVEEYCKDWIIMNIDNAGSPYHFGHELGHYFNLLHTFQGLKENVTRDENNACFNCKTKGDLLCDTPADHLDSHDYWDDCDPDARADSCGIALTPDGKNIMSYSNCNGYDKQFSAEQRAMLRHSLFTQRNYLTCRKDCALFHVLTGTHTGFYTFGAETFISSTATLADSITVHYEANLIRLMPGFRAPEGTTFSASIAPCDAFSAPPGTDDRQVVEPLAWSAILSPSLVQESTVLTLDLKAETKVSAWLISADGRTVQRIFSEKTWSEGQHEFPLRGTDWPAGVYRIVVQTATERKVLSLAKL